MTIDKIIENEKEIADMLYDQQRSHSAYYHKQLAELLEELKSYREIGTVEECRNSVLNIVRAYNKALNDFAEKIKSNDRLGYVGCLDKIIDELAEQLKVGVTND